jgi:hypothetical protein
VIQQTSRHRKCATELPLTSVFRCDRLVFRRPPH